MHEVVEEELEPRRLSYSGNYETVDQDIFHNEEVESDEGI
jgi:hypothetical protein